MQISIRGKLCAHSTSWILKITHSCVFFHVQLKKMTDNLTTSHTTNQPTSDIFPKNTLEKS